MHIVQLLALMVEPAKGFGRLRWLALQLVRELARQIEHRLCSNEALFGSSLGRESSHRKCAHYSTQEKADAGLLRTNDRQKAAMVVLHGGAQVARQPFSIEDHPQERWTVDILHRQWASIRRACWVDDADGGPAVLDLCIANDASTVGVSEVLLGAVMEGRQKKTAWLPPQDLIR